jgi:putative SOS response-associated peptidase YedK
MQSLADRRIMALAGLWENWKSPAGEMGAQLRDRHYGTERALRRTA